MLNQVKDKGFNLQKTTQPAPPTSTEKGSGDKNVFPSPMKSNQSNFNLNSKNSNQSNIINGSNSGNSKQSNFNLNSKNSNQSNIISKGGGPVNSTPNILNAKNKYVSPDKSTEAGSPSAGASPTSSSQGKGGGIINSIQNILNGKSKSASPAKANQAETQDAGDIQTIIQLLKQIISLLKGKKGSPAKNTPTSKQPSNNPVKTPNANSAGAPASNQNINKLSDWNKDSSSVKFDPKSGLKTIVN